MPGMMWTSRLVTSLM